MQIRLQYKLFLVLLFGSLWVQAQNEESDNPNARCLSCHTKATFSLYNDWTERTEKRLMNPFYIIDAHLMQTGVHQSFKCIDCHSSDYETYPHDGELKLEPLATCIDCHGGDETYASYQFDLINEEFEKSVHFQESGESFTCSKCHDQHYYTATARNSMDYDAIVEYDNKMCLSCHGDRFKFELLSDGEQPPLREVHKWLPNQKLHFGSVRCIECHTEVQDGLMVSHNILPKDKALRSCTACHSANSRLEASLYKYENIKSRETGNLGTIMANKAYVIGSYQNPIFNLISLVLICLTLSGIGIHFALRVFKKKKS